MQVYSHEPEHRRHGLIMMAVTGATTLAVLGHKKIRKRETEEEMT
jgi:hypothetical protein